MAKATTDKAKATVEAPATETPAKVEKPVFNWDVLPPSEVVEYFRSTPQDLEKTTPAVVKAAYEASYADNDGKDNPVRRAQKCVNAEQAVEFAKLFRRYTKFKGMSSLTGIPKDEPTKVIFAVRPERKPRATAETVETA
jgi:hypothetical protein